MKGNLLIIPAPIWSHVIPTLNIASIQSKNYEIYYCIPESLKELTKLIELHGFKTLPLNSIRFGLNFENEYVKQKHGRESKVLTYIYKISNKLYKLRRLELRNIIESIKPDVVLIDSFSASDFIIVKTEMPLLKKIAFFNPMLPTAITENTLRVRKEKEIIHTRSSLKEKASKLITNIKYILQFNGRTQTYWLLFRNNLMNDFRPNSTRIHLTVMENVKELMLSPIELEIETKSSIPNQVFTGLNVFPRNEVIQNEEFTKAWQVIKQTKLYSNRKIVYCTFGTYYTSAEHHKKITYFLMSLTYVATRLKDTIFICSTSRTIINTLQKQLILTDNLYLFPYVPQLEVLCESDLYITHGGLSSIKESIHYEVPMLVYPLDLEWDQKSNALKVEYHGIGKQGDIVREEPDELKRKIMSLLNDNNQQKNNIKNMNKYITAKYNKAYLENVLNDICIN
jgi:UDP:flavonoid glycosyltransferase YjiC (YdhE family)